MPDEPFFKTLQMPDVVYCASSWALFKHRIIQRAEAQR